MFGNEDWGANASQSSFKRSHVTSYLHHTNSEQIRKKTIFGLFFIT